MSSLLLISSLLFFSPPELEREVIDWLKKIETNPTRDSSGGLHVQGVAFSELTSLLNENAKDQAAVRRVAKKVVARLGSSPRTTLRIWHAEGWLLNPFHWLQTRGQVNSQLARGQNVVAAFARAQVERWLADRSELERTLHLLTWSGLMSRPLSHPGQWEVDIQKMLDRGQKWPAARLFFIAACATNQHHLLDKDDMDDLQGSFDEWKRKLADAIQAGRFRASEMGSFWVLDGPPSDAPITKLPKLIRPKTPLRDMHEFRTPVSPTQFREWVEDNQWPHRR